MSVQLVIDMNLSVEWVAELASTGGLRSTGPRSATHAPMIR